MSNMSKRLLFSVTKNDFDIQTFRSGGKGGKNVNKVETGVRVIHRDSGATGQRGRPRILGTKPRINSWPLKDASSQLSSRHGTR